MAFVHTPRQFYLVRFLLGAAEASFYPVIYASVIPRWFTPQERPQAIALMLTSLQVSTIIGAPLAGWLLGFTAFGLQGWQMLFLLESLPAVAFGVIILFVLADWPRDAPWLTEQEKEHLSACFEQETAAKKAVRHYTLWQALRDREVLKLCSIYFLWCTGFWGFNYWMPTALKELSGWSNLAIGWLIVVPMVLSMLTMMSIGASSSRTGEKRWHGAAPLFVAALGMGAGAFIRDPQVNFLCVCCTAIGVYGAFGIWWSYPTTFLSGAAAAGAVGLINSFGNVGGYVGPYLNGYVRDATGSFLWASVALACMLAAAGALMLRLAKKPPRI
jgi:predicted MFS family arabinose efflux permease